jgi:hypothetical protein
MNTPPAKNKEIKLNWHLYTLLEGKFYNRLHICYGGIVPVNDQVYEEIVVRRLKTPVVCPRCNTTQFA